MYVFCLRMGHRIVMSAERKVVLVIGKHDGSSATSAIASTATRALADL